MLEIALRFAFGCLAAYGAWMLTLRMGVAALDWYGRRSQARYDAMREAAERLTAERESRREWNDRAAQSLIEEVTAAHLANETQRKGAA